MTVGNVSRETLDRRIAAFVDTFELWSARINLVSSSERQNLPTRHVADSLQLIDHVESPASWVDLGSGGGFPGLIVAAALPARTVTLVESNAKKAAFLRAAALAMEIDARVRCERIERVVPALDAPDVVSARALASLSNLLDMAAPWLTRGSIGLFPKGRNAEEEIEAARGRHDFDVDVLPSRTATDAYVLRVTAYRPLSAAFVGSVGS